MVKKIIKSILDILLEFIRKYIFTKTIKINLNYKIYQTRYKNTFFGYYDRTPFNHKNTKLLAMATECDDILISAKEAVVGYFDMHTKKYNKIDETTTWCWQQGCRMMWWNHECFIYNKVVDNNYGCVVYDVKKEKQIMKFNFPIYDKTSDNRYALSLNFSRLQYFRPGYGYCNFLKEEDKQKVLKNDGVYLCSFENNTKNLLISLSKIISIQSDDRMIDADHYINHLKFAPDDKTFLFYHIWHKNNKRYTRAIFANIKGEILKVIDNKTFMSHYTFKNSNEVLIFTKTNQNGYHLYNLKEDTYKIIYNQLQEDGHPNIFKNQNILTDSYPNKFTREQKVMLFNENNLITLVKIYSPLRYFGEFRCDLHPRVSYDEKLVSVDFPTFNGRKIMVLELKNENN